MTSKRIKSFMLIIKKLIAVAMKKRSAQKVHPQAFYLYFLISPDLILFR